MEQKRKLNNNYAYVWTSNTDIGKLSLFWDGIEYSIKCTETIGFPYKKIK